MQKNVGPVTPLPARSRDNTGRARRAAAQRDRERTSKKILAAMGRLLARKGSASLGVNAIAREARVDKVLIYRYFGGLPDLYRAFALQGNSFPNLEEVTQGRLHELAKIPPAQAVKEIILGFARAIRHRPLTKEIMRWELQERNELTDALAVERNRQSQHWFALAPDVQDADLPAVVSILVAGQIFLTLRAKTTDTYNGIDLHSEKGWKRIETAVGLLCDLFFEHAVKLKDKNKMVRNDSSGAGKEVQP
jgi:AcrR family transcriptional regulator